MGPETSTRKDWLKALEFQGPDRNRKVRGIGRLLPYPKSHDKGHQGLLLTGSVLSASDQFLEPETFVNTPSWGAELRTSQGHV